MGFATLMDNLYEVEVTELILDFASKGDDFIDHLGRDEWLLRLVVGWYNYKPLIADALTAELSLPKVAPHLLLGAM
jgi:hypothetical protein